MGLRTGIDLVSVAAVDESLHRHAERYLRRVYTAREIGDCTAADGVRSDRLAGRFAAKEAAMKVLRVAAGEAVPWTEIEVVRQPGGWVELELHGRAAELAAAAGLGEFAVSLTHENGHAAAVVVAETPRIDRYSVP